MSKEVMRLALEALEIRCGTNAEERGPSGAITALREALADHFRGDKKMAEQPQQEPFGYFRAEPFGWTDCAETDDGAVALYEHPPAQRTPLTIREIGAVCGNFSDETIKVVRQTELANGIGLKVKT